MAQKKLLFFLILIVFTWQEITLGTSCNRCQAKEDEYVQQNLDQKFKEDLDKQVDKVEQEVFGSENQNRLFIFLSFSVPESSIASYMKQAKKYGGEIFIVGIPDGNLHSFSNKLKNLMTEYSVGISIDEREFDRFDVKSVPTIVLANQKQTISGTETLKYDKVSGHISIKTALELFEKDGDLKNEAYHLLNM